MKKTFLVMAIAALVSVNSFAQDGNRPNMEEMAQKQAEKLAEDLKLEDSNKTQFLADYQAMQKEVMALRQQPDAKEQAGDQSSKKDKKRKELTDEEAQAQLEQMIDQQKKQLDIVSTYYDKMKSYLTGNQLMRVFQRQLQGGGRQMGQRGNRQGGQQGGFEGGPQGGPQGGFPGGGDF